MTLISYHVSHEQFPPDELLALVREAEEAGFDAAFSSDHVQPWGPEQGHSGHVWTWLGAALQATRRLRFAAITVPGGWRYHPLTVAHAVATLARMFPGRLPWIALGSGEAINERAVGAGWPPKDERDARLREAAEIVRRLLAGETVDHHGLLHAEAARLWSLPRRAPALVGAALSVEGARRVARWADGLLTTCADIGQLRAIVGAFREAAGEDKPVHLKAELCWTPDEERAVEEAWRQWRYLLPGREASEEFSSPAQFDEASRALPREAVHEAVCVSADPGRHLAFLRERLALRPATLDIHQVGRNQREFIRVFGSEVLPDLRRHPA